MASLGRAAGRASSGGSGGGTALCSLFPPPSLRFSARPARLLHPVCPRRPFHLHLHFHRPATAPTRSRRLAQYAIPPRHKPAPAGGGALPFSISIPLSSPFSTSSSLSASASASSSLSSSSTTPPARPDPGPVPAAISPAVLARARRAALEHARLTARLSESYDAGAAKRAAELGPIVAAVRAWDAAVEAVQTLRELISPSNPPSSSSTTDAQSLAADDAELRALALADLPEAEAELEKAGAAVRASLAPPHPWHPLPCLIEVRPGAGGSEAGLFANEVVKMYHSFCARRGIPVRVLKYDVGAGDAGDRSYAQGNGAGGGEADAEPDTDTGAADEAPGSSDSRVKITLGDRSAQLIEAVLEIPAPGAYGLFRTEAGVHRVQRVPETETKGRTHTSTAAVMVLPSFLSSSSFLSPSSSSSSSSSDPTGNPPDPSAISYIDPKEVRTEVMRARGAGGQHVNRTESAVRLTHTPTGISVSMQDSRSQHRNRARAWVVLRARVVATRMDARRAEAKRIRSRILRPDRVGREAKIRTYNWHHARVTDHRCGYSVTGVLDDVLAGGDGLGSVMDAVRAWLVEEEVRDVLEADGDEPEAEAENENEKVD